MKKNKNWNMVWHAVVLLGLIAAAVKYINGGAFLGAVQQFNWAYAPFIMLLTLLYVLLKGWRFVSQIGHAHEINRLTVLRGYVAAQAATILPGGIAARVGMLSQAGVPPATSAASAALSSASDQVVLLSGALVSALWFEPVRRPVMLLLGVLIVISLLLGIEATRTWLFDVFERVAGKLRMLSHWRLFLSSVQDMATGPLLAAAVINAIVSFSLMIEALDLATRGIGFHPPYLTLVLAYTLPSLLGRISAMPGGVGVTEAGMIGVLDTTPGVTLYEAAAAVSIFRVGTVLFAAIVGALVYFLGWRGHQEEAM